MQSAVDGVLKTADPVAVPWLGHVNDVAAGALLMDIAGCDAAGTGIGNVWSGDSKRALLD